MNTNNYSKFHFFGENSKNDFATQKLGGLILIKLIIDTLIFWGTYFQWFLVF